MGCIMRKRDLVRFFTAVLVEDGISVDEHADVIHAIYNHPVWEGLSIEERDFIQLNMVIERLGGYFDTYRSLVTPAKLHSIELGNKGGLPILIINSGIGNFEVKVVDFYVEDDVVLVVRDGLLHHRFFKHQSFIGRKIIAAGG